MNIKKPVMDNRTTNIPLHLTDNCVRKFNVKGLKLKILGSGNN